MVNQFQKRIDQRKTIGSYSFYGVPNNEQGKYFLKMCKDYLNRDAFKFTKYGRAKTNWSSSLNESESDSFVVYLNPKEYDQREKVNSALDKKLAKTRKVLNSLSDELDCLAEQCTTINNNVETLKKKIRSIRSKADICFWKV